MEAQKSILTGRSDSLISLNAPGVVQMLRHKCVVNLYAVLSTQSLRQYYGKICFVFMPYFDVLWI